MKPSKEISKYMSKIGKKGRDKLTREHFVMMGKKSGKVRKNKSLGKFKGFVVYCNEKEYKGKGLLLKCCKGCEHNP